MGKSKTNVEQLNTLPADLAALSGSLGGKQAALVSGVNIKTVNGNSLLGSGDLVIAGGGASADEVRIASEAARDAVFNDLASTAAGKGGELVAFRQSGAGAVDRTAHGKLRESVSVKDFGAVGDGVADDTAAVNAAIAYVGAVGGGTVYLPAGVYALRNSNPTATSWDNDRAIYIGFSNIQLAGAGVGATKLRLVNNADCHVIKIGQRADGAIAVSNCSVQDMEIDGNRANQTTPGPNENHWQGIDVSSGCQRITLRDLYIHDCAYYGIGMQRDAISDSRIQNVVIENTGADGIDWKNDSGSGIGNVISNVRVKNFGLISSLVYAQAGVDMRSGIYAENIFIEGMTGANGFVGVRTLGDGAATSFGIPLQPTRIRNVTVIGSDVNGSIGIRITTRNTEVSGAHVRYCGDGVRVSRGDVRLNNVDAFACASGIRLLQDSTISTEADTISISGGVVRDCTAAGIVIDSVDEATIVGTEVRNNATGYDIRSGSTYTKIIGGSCSGNTRQIIDNGGNTFIKDVSGYRTKNVVIGAVSIDSTGTKNVTIEHGLPFTPRASDVSLTIQRNTNVGDWSLGFIWVSSVDASNIYIQMRVLTASATVGAVVDVVATVESKNR